jgi:hypothetical protein
MRSIDRRGFLGNSLAGMAAVLGGGRLLAGALQDNPRDTLFLTWQRDPTTTMTVQWVGARESADVQFAPWGTAETPWRSVACLVQPYPKTELHIHRAEFTGLQPGTEYQFRVGGSSPVHRFRTMPAKATSAIRFISGGDCGVDLHAVNNNIQAARQDPMFVLIGGDLGYDNGVSADTSLQFLRNYSRHLRDRDGRLIPLIVCIGNHEIQGGYGGPRGAAPFFFALFDGLFHDTSYNVLDFGDYLSIVLLDTGHQSPIGGEQTDWLGQTLASRTDCPHLLVYNHVPAYPSYRLFDAEGETGTGVENRKFWLPLFERYNVDVVFEHHDHTFKRTRPMLGGHVDERRGLIYLGDGSWGKIRPVRDPEKRPYLAAWSSAYHLSLHHLEGSQRVHQAIDESGRVIDICRTGKRPTSKVAC